MKFRLSENELKDLTGYKQPSAQIRWLKQYGVRFFVARNGHPRVLRTDVEFPTNQRRNSPNLGALEKR